MAFFAGGSNFTGTITQPSTGLPFSRAGWNFQSPATWRVLRAISESAATDSRT